MLYIILILLIIVGFLGFKLSKKLKIDNEQLERVKQELAFNIAQVDTKKEILQQQRMDFYRLEEKTNHEKAKLDEWKKELSSVQATYNDLVENRMQELNSSIEEQRQKRQDELNATFEEKYAKSELALEKVLQLYKEQEEKAHESATQAQKEAQEFTEEIWRQCAFEQDRFNGLLEPIKQYEKEKQERLFYTIQLPEEYHEDIEFLLTTVAAKVAHPDIISKLVWTEYVKPNLDNTFKRLETKPEPGIYKLTSLVNGKCYIGKSTNVKNRIADHFKSAVGIRSIADQAVHYAILKEGFWNWTIEVITYCGKDKLNELEKYYIEFFKSQEFGYNKNSGGGG